MSLDTKSGGGDNGESLVLFHVQQIRMNTLLAKSQIENFGSIRRWYFFSSVLIAFCFLDGAFLCPISHRLMSEIVFYAFFGFKSSVLAGGWWNLVRFKADSHISLPYISSPRISSVVPWRLGFPCVRRPKLSDKSNNILFSLHWTNFVSSSSSLAWCNIF